MKKDYSFFRYLGMGFEIGLVMVATIAVSGYIGLLLDKYFQTRIFIFVFILLGVLSGFWTIYKMLILKK